MDSKKVLEEIQCSECLKLGHFCKEHTVEFTRTIERIENDKKLLYEELSLQEETHDKENL